MLTKVEVRTSQGTLLTLLLQNPINGFLVQDIEGLDPVKATLVSSSFAQVDGQQYQSSRRESRNIKMRLGLEPDYSVDTVQDLRRRLYNFFMPKTEVELRFYTSDGLTVNVMPRVESIESALFTKEPAVDISLICFDPDFINLTSIELEGETVADTGDITEPTLVEYEGTVEAGLVFVLNVDRSLTEFTFYHRTPDDVLRTMDFAASLVAGDVVTINTIAGSKSATLLRGSTLSSLLYGVSPQSKWVEFVPGDNFIRVYAEGVPIPYTITYTPRYGGL